jgi:hypothetical protein
MGQEDDQLAAKIDAKAYGTSGIFRIKSFQLLPGQILSINLS